MKYICNHCKELAKVTCSCDNFLRFCAECYLFVHKNTQGNHDPINLDDIIKEITQKIRSDEVMKLESFKFSNNLKVIKKQLQSNFHLFLEGHNSSVYSVAVTNDNKYIVSGSADSTIRI